MSDWPDTPVKVTDESFDDFIAKYDKVVVDCWAAWCAPCRMVAPVFEALAKEHQGKIAYAKLNTDENRMTAGKFGIMSIPTFLLFNKGELKGSITGAMPKKRLEPIILENIE